LDSRVFRLDPPANDRWFDVDYPEVVELRRRLYPDRDGYSMIASSVTEPDWLRGVPGDRPAMIIAEGLLPYLPKDEVPRLFERLTAHPPSGEIAFDGYSRLGVWLLQNSPQIRATGASLHWGIDDPHELEDQVPPLKLVTELTTYDPAQIARMSWATRLTIGLYGATPAFRRLGRFLRYRF
jgi:O-methyltransferase involved in polyketide biosynthesis